MERDEVLNKLKKLFALAEDHAASEGEVRNALNRAEALIAKHNIHTAELNDLNNVDGSPWTAEEMEFTDPRVNIPNWEKLLQIAVADICGLKILLKRVVQPAKNRRDRARWVCVFFGNADSVIAYPNCHAFIERRGHGQFNGSSGLGKLDRVGQEVEKDLLQFKLIGIYLRKIVWNLGYDLQVP